MECRRCATGASYRGDVIALFVSDPQRLYNRTGIVKTLHADGTACALCCSPSKIGSMLYHLREDGIVEKVGKGLFRYRASDDATKDFVYGKRRRKTQEGEA
jgi:hypothetical protein